MAHETSLIATIAVGLVLAFVGGFVASSCGCRRSSATCWPASPSARSRRASSPTQALAGQLAEIGVILLMFGVGLHFSLDDLLAVRAHRHARRASARSRWRRRSASGWRCCWGWTFGAGLVFGLALSVASTVVLLRALEERSMLDTRPTAASPSAG